MVAGHGRRPASQASKRPDRRRAWPSRCAWRDGERFFLRRHQQARLQERRQAMLLEQHAAALRRDEQRQLAAHALPGELHGLVAVAVVEHVPAADLQLARPAEHRRRRHRAALGHHLELGALVAGEIHDQRLVDVDLLGFGQQLLERLEAGHQLLEALVRDRRGLGGEGGGQRVVEALDVLVLLRHRDARVVHAVAQRLQERRQAADHLGALGARDLGAGRPDQVGGGALHRPWSRRLGRRP